jgi:molecular chaperone HscB
MATHFEVFGLTPSVELDVKALEQKHRELSLQVHPDRLGNADAAARRKAAELSASLNEAVKVLKDPVKRAFYLLKLRGVDVESEQAASKLQMPMEFLEEIMEQREALEAAKAARSLERAQKLAEGIRAACAQSMTEAKAALTAGDLPHATVALGRVRYYTRFIEEVEAFEEELSS